MFLHVVGSLLFVAALMCALTVIVVTFRRYHDRMIAALSALSLDSVHGQNLTAAARHPAGLRSKLV